MPAHFTENTTAYWQRLLAPDAARLHEPPWRFAYPASMPDGRVLMLPIRQFINEPDRAAPALLLDQAAFDVVDALGSALGAQLASSAAEVVVGLPALGLWLARIVARDRGDPRFVPIAYSRQFWYDEALSAPLQGSAALSTVKRIYLDPHLLPLVAGKRVLLVDDSINTGSTVQAAWDLLEAAGAEVAACGVAMRLSRRWVERLGRDRAGRVHGVFDCPLLQSVPTGWVPRT